jgi:hypothetical protein
MAARATAAPSREDPKGAQWISSIRMWGSYAHMRESIEPISGFFRLLLLRLVLLFVCSSILALSRRLVPPFTSLNVHNLPRIIVLPQYALVIPSGRIKQPHDHGRTS